MRLVFLSKRRPMDRDLLTRPYGRFFHLPQLLAARGHEVTVVLLSYKKDAPVLRKCQNVTWISLSAWPAGPFAYIHRVNRIIARTRPDWVVGFSDTFYGILAQYIGSRYGVKTCIDAYDNFESYIPWMKPLHRLWRRAIEGATCVTAAGPQLGALLQKQRLSGAVRTVPMAADQPDFQPMEKDACRLRFGLPLRRKLVGYCGSMYRNRGIETLFEAFRRLRREYPEVELVLSGRKEPGVVVPENARWTGYLPDSEVPFLLNSLDVAVVINKSSAFGNFSYPVKLYEAMACRRPVVASRTEPASWILSGREASLAEPGDPVELADKIKKQLYLNQVDYGRQPDWHDCSRLFEKALRDEG